MRKKIVSLCMALALCLGLLPATALAADGDTVYVGGVTLSSSTDSPAYATTDDSGNVSTASATAANYNIKWDGSTLTLRNATIKKSVSTDTSTFIAGAAIGVLNQNGDANLTITLEGTNTIAEVSMGIYVLASSESTGSASLTITGDGILSASSGSNPGIRVQSNTGNGTLTITGAKVTASSSNGGHGVQIRCGDGSDASLTVNGGSLTATGSGTSGAGIKFQFGSSDYNFGTPSLTVSGNAMVDAKNGGIANNSSSPLQYKTGSESTGGIVFDGNTGTVYGAVTLQEDITISEGESLTIGDGASLDTNGKLTVNGGTLTGDVTGTVNYKVTGVSLSPSTLNLDVGESSTLTATVAPANAANQSVTWASSDETVATVTDGLVAALKEGTATITATTADGGETATCVVTVTAATVPVTGVTLSQTQASLYYNRTPNTLALTATVAPDNATNQAVTWTSSDSTVATVDQNGVVTALARGTAVITATAADGSGASASCTVTVSSYLPPANPNYRITVEATQGGTVTADPTAAKAGTTVTLTPSPDAGYQVGTVAVTDRFGDGTYTFTMPNGQVKVAVTFVEAAPEPLPFTDVNEGDWFHDAVRYVYDNGLMDGVGDGQFAPNATTTRAQLVTILYRLAGEPAVSGDVGFTDVEPGLWYTDAVAWAAQKGIVNGISETEFSPSGDLTREQLATILYRYAESMGYDVSAQADLSGFPDAGDIQSYATQALSWAVAEGLLQGFEDDSLRPGGTATRAQIAAVLMRFCEGVGA